MSFGVVYDVSAMLAYARVSEAAGELLTQVNEQSDVAVLPAAALAQAYRDAPDADHPMLDLLVASYDTVVLPLGADQVAAVGRFSRRVSLADAHAVYAAVHGNAILVTAEAKWLTGLVDPDMIIEL